MFVWPSARIPAIWPCRSLMPPSGWVRTTQCADSLNATTPSSSRSVSAAAARRIASLPMSTFWTPPIPLPPPPSRPRTCCSGRRAIEPDWSMTTTSAMSGCFWRSRTPMSTGRVSSSGVFW